MKDFEEKCFGTNDDDEINSSSNNTNNSKGINIKGWNMAEIGGDKNKNAYILVYEKGQKGKLKFKFDSENIKEKDQVIDRY